MPQIIQVRDVPDDVHTRLVKLAEREGLSLNRYLLDQFQRIADRDRNKEVFEEIRRSMEGVKKKPTTEQVVAAIRRARDA